MELLTRPYSNAARLIPLALLLAASGCGKSDAPDATSGTPSAPLSGTIVADGSSTVFPIAEAVGEEFQREHPDVRVQIGTSGTGGGFKKFANKETDISTASRPIKSGEAEAASKNGVEFIELPIAYDGLSLVVHPENNWCEHLTVDELKRIWEPSSKIKSWKEVRAGFPDVPLKLFGAGTDSGTFDYFTDAICGEEGASRSDYTASEDDNVLVQGVAGEKGSLGYFGYAYFEQNKDKLKLVAVDPGTGPVAPSEESIVGGSYQPLSRPLFIYVRADAASRPEIAAFVDFFLTEGAALVKDVGYMPLPQNAYELIKRRFEAKTPGSVFAGGSQVGVKIEDLLAKEQLNRP
jgi:phosphate transport system substrate-binding protein